MVCLYSCFVKNRIKLRVRVSRLGFCLLLCLCGLACSFVVAVRSISSVRLLCLALLLRGLVRLLFIVVCFAVQACSLLLLCLLLSSLSVYCALSCCSGLSSVAVVLVLSSLPVLCCYCACAV